MATQLKVGMKVKYVGSKKSLVGSVGTIEAVLGDGGYEVMFGRDLWYVNIKNLSIKN